MPAGKEIQFRQIVESIDDGIAILEPIRPSPGEAVDFSVSYLNKAGEALLGRPLNSMSGKSISKSEIFASSKLSHQEALDACQKVLESNAPFVHQFFPEGPSARFRPWDLRITRLGGGLMLQWRRSPFVPHWKKAIMDTFRVALGDAPIGASLVNEEGEYVGLNKAFCQMLGYEEADLLGQPVTRVTHPDDVEWDSGFRNRLFSGEKLTQSIEKRFIKKNGCEIWIRRTASVIRDPQGGAFLFGFGIMEDITQKKESERLLGEQQQLLLRTAKMSALGQMASGISHEINNPLTVILGNAYLLQKLSATGELDAETLARLALQIEETSIRISKIIEGLRKFSHDGTLGEFESYSVAALFQDTMAFCKQRFRQYEIQLATLCPDGLEVHCSPVQISEVILNLLNNSYSAIQGLSEKWIRLEAKSDAEWVVLSVTDCGPGIPSEIQEKIFVPFFSTKPIGQGTGLGLSLSKGIAEAHGGSLVLDVGSPFTRFELRIPVAPKNDRAGQPHK